MRTRHPVTFIWMWNLVIETKGYKKTKDNSDEIHDTYGGIQFVRP